MKTMSYRILHVNYGSDDEPCFELVRVKLNPDNSIAYTRQFVPLGNSRFDLIASIYAAVNEARSAPVITPFDVIGSIDSDLPF